MLSGDFDLVNNDIVGAENFPFNFLNCKGTFIQNMSQFRRDARNQTIDGCKYSKQHNDTQSNDANLEFKHFLVHNSPFLA